MKKLIVLIYFIILSGCISTSSDGGLNLGMTGSTMWFKTSSEKDKEIYFNETSVSEICRRFKNLNEGMLDTRSKSSYYTDQQVQLQIMKGLVQKGYDKNYCGKPNLKKFTRLEDKWVNSETNEYDTPRAKRTLALCEAKGDLAKMKARNRQEEISNQEKGGGIAVGIVRGLNIAAAGIDAYQSVLQGCMADKGYLKQKVRVTVD